MYSYDGHSEGNQMTSDSHSETTEIELDEQQVIDAILALGNYIWQYLELLFATISSRDSGDVSVHEEDDQEIREYRQQIQQQREALLRIGGNQLTSDQANIGETGTFKDVSTFFEPQFYVYYFSLAFQAYDFSDFLEEDEDGNDP